MRRVALVLILCLLPLHGPARAQDANGARGCDLANADIQVAGILLGNSESTRLVLGKDYRIVLSDPQTDYPWLIVASRDNKQLLRLRKHAGGGVDSYLEFEVKYGRDERRPFSLGVYEFVTGKGVKLGLRKKNVIARLGPCFVSKTAGKSETIHYEIKEKSEGGVYRSPLLRAANMPEYYAEYEFDHDRLVRFRFGHAPI